MQNTIYRLTCCSLLLGLSACNDNNSDSQNPPANQKQLTSIERWIMDDMGNPLTQKERIAVKYSNNRISEFNTFDDSGADKQWGTADDRAYSQILCRYSGKTTGSLRDQSIQFGFPPALMADSISGTILMSMLGINQRRQSLCALDYQNDSSMIEDEYIIKLQAPFPQSKKPLFHYHWTTIENKGAVQGTSITSALQEVRCNPASCLDPRLGTRTNSYALDYANSADLLVDRLNHLIYRYSWLNGQLIKTEIFTYPGDADSAITQLNTLPLQSVIQYHYSNNQVRICTQYKSAIGGEQVLETYSDTHLIQYDHFNAGEDSIACSSDDALIQRIKYNYQ